MDAFADRRQRLVALLGPDGADAFLISDPINVTYLTGFSGDSSFLIQTRKRAILVSDGRFTTQIAEECPGLETVIRTLSQTTSQAVSETITKLGPKSVEFEAGYMTVGDLERYQKLTETVDWKAGQDRVEQLRAVKDVGEIAAIREAIDIAERAFANFRRALRPTDREKDLADTLELDTRRAGGRCSSFPSIIAAGDRAALPHATPTDRAIGSAELLLVDWGASGRFYQSDLTRVLATRKIGPQFEKIYNIVLEAQMRAIRAIRPGVKACDVDSVARSWIKDAGYGNEFNHSLGHGIGLRVHEAPSLRQTSDAVLDAGMVVTVEPGIYLPGWGGIRIEDDVLVTPDGAEVLTTAPKDLATVTLGF
jgi:Xaa-Pro aminopeptidase